MVQPIESKRRRPTSVDTCAERLRASIVRGELVAGAALPPERSLAESLGVNRTTLRAAIHRLAEGGLLEAQQGRGTFVRDFRATASVQALGATVGRLAGDARLAGASLDATSLARDLLLVRRCLARAVLETLAQAPPGDAEIARVEEALVGFEVAVARRAPLAELAAADVGVVGAIVAATGRPGLSLCMNPVVRTLAELPELTAALYAEPAENVRAFRSFLPFLRSPRLELVEPLIATIAERDARTLDHLHGAAR